MQVSKIGLFPHFVIGSNNLDARVRRFYRYEALLEINSSLVQSKIVQDVECPTSAPICLDPLSALSLLVTAGN